MSVGSDHAPGRGSETRHIGMAGATGIGVGAIVGGGILALAGVAFATTGPGAIAAFALNGVIALITAASFAELSSRFPVSGGTYAFAKKVLSIEVAFTVGWVVWFASIVASVLYAIGFGAFFGALIDTIWRDVAGSAPGWGTSRAALAGLALGATLLLSSGLMRGSGGGGQWANVGKVVVFGVLILGGFWAMARRPIAELGAGLMPFFPHGAAGLLQAMGFTFIALQGFDLIAAVAGEIREPRRNIPRAMFVSLGIALAIYLPLLLVIATVGSGQGRSIAGLGADNPEILVAAAARNYLGRFGYWLVMVAGVLSMLSALQANLFAASRVARAMATDRLLPRVLGAARAARAGRDTPAAAITATVLVVMAVILIVPDVASAGAAASLVFLVTFALAHFVTIVVRRRDRGRAGASYRAPFFPMLQIAGGAACVGLALFQGLAVPAAGTIVVIWLSIGGGAFLVLFAEKARVADASASALDPELVRLRGHSPLVLVPMADPDHAAAMVAVAHALAPPDSGRVLLLSILVAGRDWRPGADPKPLRDTQAVLGEALTASIGSGLYPETLATVAAEPWPEIARVARAHRCESLVLGFNPRSDGSVGAAIDSLMSRVDCDIVLLRSPKGWNLGAARRILVAVGGRGGHDRLLGRLLGSIARIGARSITFLRVLPNDASARVMEAARRQMQQMPNATSLDGAAIEVIGAETPAAELARRADTSDLLIMGVRRLRRRQKLLGEFTTEVARRTGTPIILICRRR